MVERWKVYYLDYNLLKSVIKDQVRNDTSLENFEGDFINLVEGLPFVFVFFCVCVCYPGVRLHSASVLNVLIFLFYSGIEKG